MKRKFVLIVGFIMFVAFVWMVTTIGLKNSVKRDDKSIMFCSLENRQQNINIFDL